MNPSSWSRKYSVLRPLLFLALATLLSACEPVGSVHSLYEGDEGKVVAEPKLLGTWDYYDGKQLESTWIFEPAEESSYRLTWRDHESGDTVVYHVVLVRLAGMLFLDASPDSDALEKDYGPHLLALHSFHRLQVDDNTLRLAWLDDSVLENFLQERPGEIAHVLAGSKIVLTAPSEELREFVVHHAGDLFRMDKDNLLLFYRRENNAHLQSLENQLLLNPGNAALLGEIADDQVRLGQYEEARQTLERAIELDPTDSVYRERLGTVWLFLDDSAKARQAFQGALALSDSTRAQLGLGISYFVEWRFTEATRAFGAVNARNQGRSAEDGLWYVLALELTGNHIDAEQTLAQLESCSGWDCDLRDYFRDHLSAGELVRRARTDQQLCRAGFYIGMRTLAHGDWRTAHARFQQAADTGAFDTLEYAAARAFLS